MIKFKNQPDYILNRFIISSAIFLLIGSFFDLQISKFLYARTTFYPTFIRFTGEMPMIFFSASIAFNLLYRYIKLLFEKNYKNINLSLFVLSIVGFILPAFISANGIPDYFENSSPWLWLIIFSSYLVFSIILSPLFSELDIKELEKFFKFVFSIVLLSMIVMNLMKNIWTRARFFAMFEKNDYNEFSSWIIPQFRKHIIDTYKSFPSGHTTSASVILSLLFLPKEFDRKTYTKPLKILAIIWPLAVALGRILDGAHYLTDVSFAILFTCLIIKLSHKVIYRNEGWR